MTAHLLDEPHGKCSVTCGIPVRPGLLGILEGCALTLELLPPNGIPPKSKTGWGSFI